MKKHDSIAKIVQQWQEERPDLDPAGFEVVGRILVLAEHLKKRVEDVVAPLGLNLWGFDVLATLRRSGPPYRLTPTELSHATMLTSGAMTNRLDHLEEAGLVRRERNPADRRGILVLLTDRGLELVDKGLEARFDEANDAVTALALKKRPQLAALLEELLTDLESR